MYYVLRTVLTALGTTCLALSFYALEVGRGDLMAKPALFAGLLYVLDGVVAAIKEYYEEDKE